MKQLTYLLLFFSVFQLNAQSLTIDESNARISFVFLDDDVDGTISDFKFTGSLDLYDLNSSAISGSVAMETLDTNNWLRNRHLRAKKYFYAKKHPRLSFSSTSVTALGEGFRVEGNLTIKGISKRVSFFFKKSASVLRGTTSINTSDFDIFVHKKAERNNVDITLVLPYSVSN